MNYWDRYALKPVEFLRVGSSICICLIGLADALIFSLREKPWQGIETSDGTFWGSFRIPRKASGDIEVDTEGVEVRGGVGGGGGYGRPRGRGSSSYRTSASGDYARAAAEQARLRLDMEREERLKTLGDRAKRESLGSWGEDGGSPGERYGNLNVGDGREGQIYDDNGLEDDTVESPYNIVKKLGGKHA